MLPVDKVPMFLLLPRYISYSYFIKKRDSNTSLSPGFEDNLLQGVCHEIFFRPPCSDEILISDVNSDKSSLTIIYICLKMYCHEICC